MPNVCVARNAILRFHAPYCPDTHEIAEETRKQMLAAYPPALRALLIARHALDATEFKVELTGAELINLGFRECT